MINPTILIRKSQPRLEPRKWHILQVYIRFYQLDGVLSSVPYGSINNLHVPPHDK